MPRDYARHGYVQRRKRATTQWQTPLLLAAAFALLMGGGTLYWMKTHKTESARMMSAMTSIFTHTKSLFKHKNATVQQAKNKTPATDPDDGVRFDFYTELPKMQVTVPVVADAKLPPPIHTAMATPKPAKTEMSNKIDEAIESALASKQ